MEAEKKKKWHLNCSTEYMYFSSYTSNQVVKISVYSVSDEDDEIDYSVKKELWMNKERKGCGFDAVLTCPACFTALCIECQRRGKYLTRYRAIFIANCKIKLNQVLRPSYQKPKTSNNKWKRWWN
ncbi:hypothetical protein MKX03_002805 [Papaver bracteatum]|nr:hypothetical protein MKX03_002805 [Papaver bracteatum]